MAIDQNASLGDKIKYYYSQGYSGPQVAAALQQSGVTPQQASDATGIPVDTWNQAFGGASQYAGGIVIQTLFSQATGSGKVVQTGYEAEVNGYELSIQKIEILAKHGRIS